MPPVDYRRFFLAVIQGRVTTKNYYLWTKAEIMTYTICYVSKAREDLSQTQVEEIFKTTQQNNSKRNIHGILMYGMGDFFQVLEGEEKVIEELFEDYIKLDPRHSDIFEIIRRPTQQPIFSEYSSVFSIVRTEEQLEDIKTYLAINKLNTTSNKLRRLLNPFLLEL